MMTLVYFFHDSADSQIEGVAYFDQICGGHLRHCKNKKILRAREGFGQQGGGRCHMPPHALREITINAQLPAERSSENFLIGPQK